MLLPLRQNTHCSRTKDPADELEILSPPLLSEKVLELGEGVCKHWLRKVHPSTCLPKTGQGQKK